MTLNRGRIIQTALNMFTKLAEIISATCMCIIPIRSRHASHIGVPHGHRTRAHNVCVYVRVSVAACNPHVHAIRAAHAFKRVSMHVISRVQLHCTYVKGVSAGSDKDFASSEPVISLHQTMDQNIDIVL